MKISQPAAHQKFMHLSGCSLAWCTPARDNKYKYGLLSAAGRPGKIPSKIRKWIRNQSQHRPRNTPADRELIRASNHLFHRPGESLSAFSWGVVCTWRERKARVSLWVFDICVFCPQGRTAPRAFHREVNCCSDKKDQEWWSKCS